MGKKPLTPSALSWTATFTSPAPTPSCCPANWRPCWAGRYVEFYHLPSLLLNFSNSTERLNPVHPTRQLFQQYPDAGRDAHFLANLRYAPEPCRYLHDIYNSVVLNDVVRRNKIRDVDLLARIVAYVIGNMAQRARIHIHCEVSEKRTPHGCARNGAELHQVLHRSVPVLSGQSGGFAGQTDSRDERGDTCRQTRLAGSGVRREHEGHQPHS